MEVVCIKLDADFITRLDHVVYYEEWPADPTKIYNKDKWNKGTTESKPGWQFSCDHWTQRQSENITTSNIVHFIPGVCPVCEPSSENIAHSDEAPPKKAANKICSDISPYLTKEMKFFKCKVGSIKGLEVNEAVRHEAYEKRADPVFNCPSEMRQKIYLALKKLYPEDILKFQKIITEEEAAVHHKDSYAERDKNCAIDRAHVMVTPHIYYHSLVGRSRYDFEYDERYGCSDDEDYGEVDRDHLVPSHAVNLLLYKTGGFFKEHSDSPVSAGSDRKFATTLIFIPTKMKGGDLVLTPKGGVYDPDNLLVNQDGKVRLRVSELTVPVLISFLIRIPHEVEPVTEGYRLCFKMSQDLPGVTNYFTNTERFDQNINFVAISKLAVESKYMGKIAKLRAKITKIEHQIYTLNQKAATRGARIDDFEKLIKDSETIQEMSSQDHPIGDSLWILDMLTKNPGNHIIILKSGASSDTRGDDDSSNSYGASVEASQTSDYNPILRKLANLSTGEIFFVRKVMELFPYSHIQRVNARRSRVSYNDNMCDQDEVEQRMAKPGKGELMFPSFPKNTKIHYLVNPNDVSIGFRYGTNTEYNDSDYCGYDQVSVYALFVQGNCYL